MTRNLAIPAAAALIVALPFLLRERPPAAPARVPGAERATLTVITPHNDAIRREFGRAFSAWHAERHGAPVDVRWIVIGGTTEISRYLEAQYTEAARAWWKQQGRPWRPGMGERMLDRKFDAAKPPAVARADGESGEAHAARAAAGEARWREDRDLWLAFRATDDPRAFTSRIDVFFGGGQYDFHRASGQGLLVAPWPADRPPAGLFANDAGVDMIPAKSGGEVWRTDTYFGAALSTIGIAYNLDRLADAGVPAPATWDDLASPAFFRALGMADPTKSGSVAKAFEMIVHQKCREAVGRAGFGETEIDAFETAIAAAKLPPGAVPPGVPAAYQRAVEEGWLDGVRLIQRIGANARYFTDSSSKTPIDVGTGQVAAGLAIDFYARFQEQYSRGRDGRPRMRFVTPAGGSSVSADPIALLRGAERRDLAVRFLVFTLGEEGQRLWSCRAGEPGGPDRYALRRLPIRRDFYPSPEPAVQAAHVAHLRHASEDLASPEIDPYRLAGGFVYRPRWTSGHFAVLRDIIRAMCIDSQDELQAAWGAILRAGGPDEAPGASAMLGRLPDRPQPLTWRTALEAGAVADRQALLTAWTTFFRASYREAGESPLPRSVTAAGRAPK
ncbi:MAG: extracellular solute-binding protein [Lentisphaerae bacterium]|nr:extracellular solute-binding protein [Lentisphaerota bacterium]